MGSDMIDPAVVQRLISLGAIDPQIGDLDAQIAELRKRVGDRSPLQMNNAGGRIQTANWGGAIANAYDKYRASKDLTAAKDEKFDLTQRQTQDRKAFYDLLSNKRSATPPSYLSEPTVDLESATALK